MYRVGIRAPLDHREATWVVAGLAEWLQSLGHECSWFPLNRLRRDPEDFGWKGETCSSCRFADWCRTKDWIVWVEPSQHELLTAVRHSIRNLLVWLPTGFHSGSLPLWSCYETILAPSQVSLEGIRRLGRGIEVTRLLWAPHQSPITRWFGESRERVLVPICGETARQWGPSLCYLLELVISRIRCTLLVVIMGRWSRPCQLSLRDLLRRHPGRVEVWRHPSRSGFLAAEATADVMFVPSLCSRAGWPVLDALWAGLPAVAFSVPPFTEIVRPGRHGYLLECSQEWHDDGLVVAAVNRRRVLEELEEVLQPSRIESWVRTQPWQELEARRSHFEDWLARAGWVGRRSSA